MKKFSQISFFLLLSWVVLSGLWSCNNKGFPPINFGISLPTLTIPIPPAPSGLDSFSQTFPSSSRDSILATQGAPGYRIISTEIESQKFSVSGKGKNFNNFEYFETWIAAPGLPDLKIAEKNPIHADINTFSMDTLHQELVNYFNSDQYTLKMKIKLKSALTDSMFIRQTARFHFSVEY